MQNALRYKPTGILCPKCQNELKKEIGYNKTTKQIMITVGCTCGFAIAITSDRHQLNNVGDGAKLLNAAMEVISKRELLLSGN
jgi:hypothetical protein